MAETVDELRITYPLGTRIRLDASAGSAGTVRYVGAIANHPGLWLGIEWDDAARGRHDGHVGDVRYFSTAAATSGSMIRPGRLAPRCSLRSAIERRYILSADHQLDERLMADTQRRLRASIFEIVGMDKVKEKQSHWDGLNIVAVQNSSVYMAGILTQLTHLSDLHLCDSLIGDWATVADILRQVPSVQLLNLSQNRLQAPSDAELVSLRPHFARLRAINLRDCGLSSWPSVLRLARMWPAIRDVSLQENGIAELPAAVDVVPAVDDAQPPCFGQLESLDLSGNEIVDFAEIINLGRLHTLRALNVAENRIATVQLPDCEADEYLDIFGGLVEINLKENPIADDVRAFNELDKLAALTTLLWTADGTADRGFEHLHTNAVARLTGLQQLNQMLVVPSERRGAEYDLWKALANEWLKTAQDEAGRRAFSRECRAYHRLVEKYGPPDAFAAAPKVSNLITIHLQTADASSTNRPPISKRVSRKMSVQALQGVALKLLAARNDGGGGSANGMLTMPRLSYLDRGRGDLKIDMENLSKSLDYYSVQDGDTVILEW